MFVLLILKAFVSNFTGYFFISEAYVNPEEIGTVSVRGP